MKPISLLYIILFWTLSAKAQVITYSESLADAVVATEKGAIKVLLVEEEDLRKDQRDLLKDLKKLEDEYADKRTPLANNTTALVIGAIEFYFSDIRSRIDQIEHHINSVKFFSLGLYQLQGIKEQLQREKKYLNKLEAQLGTLRSGLVFSGSAGDNYTVYLKLLIRLTPIKNNVLAIEKEIKVRKKISELLEKQILK